VEGPSSAREIDLGPPEPQYLARTPASQDKKPHGRKRWRPDASGFGLPQSIAEHSILGVGEPAISPAIRKSRNPVDRIVGAQPASYRI
jgi:hypothetical protein